MTLEELETKVLELEAELSDVTERMDEVNNRVRSPGERALYAREKRTRGKPP